MERTNENLIDQTELADEDLDGVAGGRYYYNGFIWYPKSEGNNGQLWVLTST